MVSGGSVGQSARAWAFAGVSGSALAVSAVAGAPAPLNTVYVAELGVDAAGLTGAFAIYIVCAALTLLTCGRLSDFLGRRPVSLIAIGLAAMSCLVFTQMSGVATLLLGRGLQGMAVGMGMSALGAFVVDLQPARFPQLASVVTSVAPTLGVGSGAVASGALVQWAPHPTTLVFVIFLVLMLVCAGAVLAAPEPVSRRVGAWGSLVPRVAVPRRMRRTFLGSCACFIACWSLGGLYQSLGPSIAAEVLGLHNHLIGGVVAASVIGPTLVGGLAMSRLPVRTAMVVGLLMLIEGVGAIVSALEVSSAPLFFGASVVAGIGFGGAFGACMRNLLSGARPEDSAGLLSAVYLVGFLGSALPSAIGGFLVPAWGLIHVAQMYAGFVTLLALVAIFLSRPSQSASEPVRPAVWPSTP